LRVFRKAVGVIAAVTAATALIPLAAADGATSAQSSSGTIKVGSIISATNPSGGLALPQAVQALKASIAGFNKRGGANGQKFQLDFCDAAGDANKEADCARKMVSDHVVATLDDFTYNNSATTAKILENGKIPRIGINLADVSEFSSPVSWPLSAGPIAYFVTMGQAMIKAGHKKLAEVIVQTPTAGAVKSLLEPGFKALGGDIVTEVQIPPGATDYSQFVAAATQNGADAALLLVDYPDASRFMDAMQQLNSKLLVGVSASSFTIDNFKKYSAITKKAQIADATPNVTSSAKQFPGVTQFRRDMLAGGLTINGLKGQASGAWTSVLALVNVLDQVKPATVTNDTVTSALNTAKDVNMEGLMPPWTPTNPSEYSLFPRVSNPYMFVQHFNGKTIDTQTPPVDVMAIMAGKSS